ncbi:hypothetical protein EMGBS4_19690, partial [Acidimicrobiaceae bacterium]
RTIVLNLSIDANTQIRKMYDEIVKIYGDENHLVRRIIWWSSKFGLKVNTPAQVMSDKSWQDDPPSVDFSSIENDCGYSFLKSSGVIANDKFICYATRTESYYTKLIEQGVVVKPRSIRNPDEKIYLDVASKLAENDFAIFRMGKDLDSKISEGEFPKILITRQHLGRIFWIAF